MPYSPRNLVSDGNQDGGGVGGRTGVRHEDNDGANKEEGEEGRGEGGGGRGTGGSREEEKNDDNDKDEDDNHST